MSYILDALTKATIEREHQHGSIPDINAQPGRSQPNYKLASGAGLGGKRLMTAAAVLATSIIAAFFWRVSFQSAPVRAVPLNVPAERMTVTTPSAPSPSLNPNIEVPALPVMLAPLPSALSKSGDLTPSTSSSRQTQRASANAPPIAPLAVAAGTQSPSRSSLPPLPNTAPKLLVSGSTYSDNPAYRILIVNGQLFREGESPATGIKIEKIGVRAAVLQYEGSSFFLKY